MVYVLGVFLLVAGAGFLVLGSRLYGQPKVGQQISAWRTLVPVLDEPADRFYARLYQALKASLQERLPEGMTGSDGGPHTSQASVEQASVEIVLTGLGFGPHRLFASPSLFAERPLYLLVRYQHLKCYVYAGQTPTGLFVSAWGYSDYHVGEGADRRLAFTKRGWSYFSKQTLFQFDAALMFTAAVHEILSSTVDAYRQEEGLQPLEALERRPVLHAFYQNPFYGNPFYRDQQQQPGQFAPGHFQPHHFAPPPASPSSASPPIAPPHPLHLNSGTMPSSSFPAAPASLFAMDSAPPSNPATATSKTEASE